MSKAYTIKCPTCGAFVEFDPESQQFVCPFCDNQINPDEVTPVQEPSSREKEDSGNLSGYHCQTCGAEVMTTTTTAATRCYYCHSPIMLTDRLSDEFHPDGVVPFQLDKEAAEQAFEQYLSKKRFVDRRFFDAEQRENIGGVYYPYWFSNVHGRVSFEGQGTRISVVNSPRETITTTRYYRVEKEGKLSLWNYVRKALTSNDRKLSDGIHPYDLSAMRPFHMGFLSGFLAEKRDVEFDEVKEGVLEEARKHAETLMLDKKGSFDTLRGKTNFEVKEVNRRYCLLPTWVLTYRGDQPGTTYFFMMNGQNGKTCGRLPIDWKKLLGMALTIGGAVFGLLCAGGAWIW